MHEDEKPDEKPDSGLKDFLSKILGGEAEADQFFSDLEPDPMQEAWVGFHELYRGLRSGGFSQTEATQIMAAYLYIMCLGGGTDGGQL